MINIQSVARMLQGREILVEVDSMADFKSVEGAKRFWRAVPASQRAVVDGAYYVVRENCTGPELEALTVYGAPLTTRDA